MLDFKRKSITEAIWRYYVNTRVMFFCGPPAAIYGTLIFEVLIYSTLIYAVLIFGMLIYSTLIFEVLT